MVVDIEGGLVHNKSVDVNALEQSKITEMRSAAIDPINEEDENKSYDQHSHQGLQRGNYNNQSGASMVSSQVSVFSKKRATLDPAVYNLQLQESRALNNRKTSGVSSIRSLIRSAATRK